MNEEGLPEMLNNNGGELVLLYSRNWLSGYCTAFLDLKILQSKYSAILRSFPDEFSQTLDNLQDDLTPDCICEILSDEANSKLANKKMLDCMIAKVSSKEGLLDLFDQLERVSNASDMTTVVSQLRTGE